MLEDFLGKAPKLKIMLSLKTPIGRIQDIDEQVVEIKELNPIQSINFLRKKSLKDISRGEIQELMEETDFQIQSKSEKASFYEHPLFTLINGHPLALTMVASLRKEMNLKQIYDLLELIRAESSDKIKLDSENIAINLSLEASLVLLRNIDYHCYLSLLTFAIQYAPIKFWTRPKNPGLSHKILDYSKNFVSKLYKFS
jgi:hypothetical protein